MICNIFWIALSHECHYTATDGTSRRTAPLWSAAVLVQRPANTTPFHLHARACCSPVTTLCRVCSVTWRGCADYSLNVILEKLPSIKDRGRTDRVDLDLWTWPSIQGQLWSWPTHTKTSKFNGQSVEKIEWKRTDRQTDRHDWLHYLSR